jgi:hypothetical protein
MQSVLIFSIDSENNQFYYTICIFYPNSEFWTKLPPEFQLRIAGSMSDEIDNRMDQVSHLSLLFISSGLIFAIRFPFLSILKRKLENRVYAGCSSSSHLYTSLYMIVIKKYHIYAALYMIV